MEALPTLYKTTKGGLDVQQWTISFGNNGVDIGYLVEFGKFNGKIQSKFNPTNPKNIGKSNQTTAMDQAKSEAISRWKKQIDKGYCDGFMNDKEIILPMLAHKFLEHKDKVEFPCYIQPKLNGIRCLAIHENGKYKLISRKNKVFTAVDHISDYLDKHVKPCSLSGDYPIFDGELYIHDTPLQKLRSLTAKQYIQSLEVEFHVYDIAERSSSFKNRFYDGIYDSWDLNCDVIIPVETFEVQDLDEINGLHDVFKQNGYEGSIIRSANGFYAFNQRSYDLLKLKDFITEEFEIVGAEQNEHSPDQCSLILKTSDGKEFKSKPEGTTEYREKIWEEHESLIGKFATVRFYEWTPDGIPFHGVVEVIRDYE